MVTRDFGDAGRTLVVEECLTGPEASFFVLCDGTRALPMGTAQDHKRAFDGDLGPNTGGMGAFAPAVVLDPATLQTVTATVVEPVIRGMAAEGIPFRGFLYVGLMLTAEGPKVIEFNVRFGDPEAQVIVPAIEEPLAPLLHAAAGGALAAQTVRVSPARFVGVVLASGGYPGAFERGKPISGLERLAGARDVVVFQAGTTTRDGCLVTDGGRVLTVVGRGATYEAAMARAYEAIDALHFEGRHYRRDIGLRAVAASTR
jgi:phosphoribosylamine--glycine ligase